MNYPDEWENYRTQQQNPHYDEIVKKLSFIAEMLDIVSDTMKDGIEYKPAYEKLKFKYDDLAMRFNKAIQVIKENNLVEDFEERCRNK